MRSVECSQAMCTGDSKKSAVQVGMIRIAAGLMALSEQPACFGVYVGESVS